MSEFEDLVAELGNQRAELREQRGIVDDLRRVVSELGGDYAEQRDTIKEISTALDELMARISPDAQRPVDWRKLDQQHARAEWDRLCRWIADDLAPIYTLTRGELPDCWTRHPRMRNDLSWLRVAYEQSLQPDAMASAAADWHTRHLPNARAALVAEADRLGCTGSRHGFHGPSPDTAVLDEVTRADVWDTTGIDEDVATRPAMGHHPPDQQSG